MNAEVQLSVITNDNAAAALRQLLRERKLAASNDFSPSAPLAAVATRNRWLNSTLAPVEPPEPDLKSRVTASRRLLKAKVRQRLPIALLALAIVLLCGAFVFAPDRVSLLQLQFEEKATVAAEKVVETARQVFIRLRPPPQASTVPPANSARQRSAVMALRAENTALRDRLELIKTTEGIILP